MITTRKELNYKGLAQVKKLIQLKISESIPFAANFVPGYIQTPEDCFMWLKTKTRYEHDPAGVELLQSFQSLILDNFHGVPGAGDCDCLTIAGAAALQTRRRPANVKLIYAGNGDNPTHIFLTVNEKAFDLTLQNFGECRNYRNYSF